MAAPPDRNEDLFTAQPYLVASFIQQLRRDGKGEQAGELTRTLLARSPRNSEGNVIARALLQGTVPDWHGPMLRDQPRNDAFQSAIDAAVRPGMRVLDIGSGSGLLALMAARAGAAKVFSCEENQTLVHVARQNVQTNGFTEAIEILATNSRSLTAASLGGRVDLILAEIIANDIIGEGVLPALNQAVRDLLKPGGRVIPRAATIHAGFAFDPSRVDERFGIVNGFDLSAINDVMPLQRRKSKAANLQLLSDPAEIFHFDFAADPPLNGEAAVPVATRNGVANVIVQWFTLAIDASATLANGPDSAERSSWPMVTYPLAEPLTLHEGELRTLCGSYHETQLSLWAPDA